MSTPLPEARRNLDAAPSLWDLAAGEWDAWFGGSAGPSKAADDGGVIGGIYRGIFGAQAGDTYTSTGVQVPPWFWIAAAVMAGAVVWKVVRR